MSTYLSVRDFEDALQGLCSRRDHLIQETNEIEGEIQVLKEAFEIATQWKEGQTSQSPANRHSHIRPERLSHFPTQHDALMEIARLSDGCANATDAAPLMVEAGLSKGKRRSIISTLHKFQSERTNLWQWVEPGLFRLLEPANNPQSEPEESTLPGFQIMEIPGVTCQTSEP